MAVAPHGRPAGCSPCSTVQRHSLGPINNSQHSNNEGGRRGKTDGEENRGERGKRENEGERRKENQGRRRKGRERKGKETKDKGGGRNSLSAANSSTTAAVRESTASASSSTSTSTASSSSGNTSVATNSAPGNSSFPSPFSGFYLFFLLHAERIAFCMQGWGEINSPRLFWSGPGGSWPSPAFWAESGPDLYSGPGLAQKIILFFWAENGPIHFGPKSAQHFWG